MRNGGITCEGEKVMQLVGAALYLKLKEDEIKS